MTLEFNLFMGRLLFQLNEVEKKLFETEERADLAEVKVSNMGPPQWVDGGGGDN